jgi:hypothetical protein
MTRRCFLLVLMCCLVFTAGGCSSSNRGAVKGKVTVNGEPLKEGQLSFIPLDPRLGPSAGAPVTNGAYQIDAVRGPLPGEYQVQINAFRKTGKKTWDGMGDENAAAGQKNLVEEIEAFIPSKYNTASDLRATIKAGEVNIYDFDIKIDGK